MDAVTATLSRTGDTGIRPHGTENTTQKHDATRERAPGAPGGDAEGSGGQHIPSRYMVLISRLDHAGHEPPIERGLLDELTSLLTARLAVLSAPRRRALAELASVQALGVEDVRELPRVIAEHLRAGTQREAVLALLRAPEFAAAIKDETRNTTYGPRGLLHVS